MRLSEALAWAECLDVKPTEVPVALAGHVRRLESIRSELSQAHRALAESPDATLAQSLWRSVAALGAAEARLHEASMSARRSA